MRLSAQNYKVNWLTHYPLTMLTTFSNSWQLSLIPQSKSLGFERLVTKTSYDDQDAEAGMLLDAMYDAHMAWINDKTDRCKQICLRKSTQRGSEKTERNERRTVVMQSYRITGCF